MHESWGESVEGQRKPERPAECKALPARHCPYYIVRRSRCGFLTLLLSLYSHVLGSARVPRVADGVPLSQTLLPSFLLSSKTVSARRRNQHARRVRCPKYSSDAPAHRNVTGKLPATPGDQPALPRIKGSDGSVNRPYLSGECSVPNNAPRKFFV